MTEELLKIIQADIVRCIESQNNANGSFELYQALVGKYNSKSEILRRIYRKLEKPL
jgi:hypothetical protein